MHKGCPHRGATLFTYSSLAQLVEQRTVNPLVAGSSPAGGAIWDSSLRGRSTGLKNRRMKVRHLPVPPLGAIDESAKSPASQAGGCEFKPHWHHQTMRCVGRIGRVTALSRRNLRVRPPYASPLLGRVVERSITADCKSAAFGLRWFKSNLSHHIADRTNG